MQVDIGNSLLPAALWEVVIAVAKAVLDAVRFRASLLYSMPLCLYGSNLTVF
jgi:hypothetical protein